MLLLNPEGPATMTILTISYRLLGDVEVFSGSEKSKLSGNFLVPGLAVEIVHVARAVAQPVPVWLYLDDATIPE